MSQLDLNPALAVVLAACDAALAALGQRPESSPDTDTPAIRADLLALLDIISHNSTKAALALKPSKPSYSASVAPLTEIAARIAAIAHCVRLFTPSHGCALLNEATSLARQVIEAVRSLAQTLLATGDDYLVRTAAVHDLIDKARGPEGLSADNVSAVRKLWLSDQASLVDGCEELVQMIDATPTELDDGWDELGLGTEHLSLTEIERAKKVCSRPTFLSLLIYALQAKNLLHLSTLLHKRVVTNLLSGTYGSDSNPHLDLLPRHSSALLIASDNLIATMYGPQNVQNMATELASFKSAVQNLQDLITPLLQDKTKKWFNACFEQIYKAADALQGIIDTGS